MWAVKRLFASGDEDEGEFRKGGVFGKAIGEAFELREEAFSYSSSSCSLLEVARRRGRRRANDCNVDVF